MPGEGFIISTCICTVPAGNWVVCSAFSIAIALAIAVARSRVRCASGRMFCFHSAVWQVAVPA